MSPPTPSGARGFGRDRARRGPDGASPPAQRPGVSGVAEIYDSAQGCEVSGKAHAASEEHDGF